MLTDNQTTLILAVCERSRTTGELAGLLNEHGDEFGVDAARSSMSRMEKRGLVTGDGTGLSRVWTPTVLAYEAAGVEPPRASNPDDGLRGYVVLEERPLTAIVAATLEGLGLDVTATLEDFFAALAVESPEDARPFYDRVTNVTARNTEHAFRHATKEVYSDGEGAATLVAVAAKQWKPTVVRFQTRQTVSVG